MARATVTHFGIQTGTDRTLYAFWSWSKDHTENYEVKWMYTTGDKVSFLGTKTTVEEQQDTYTPPDNALSVKFYVKPISEKKTENDKQVDYWTADWSTEKMYTFADAPTMPTVPTVEIKGYMLYAELDNLDVNGTSIEFEIVQNNNKVFKVGKANINLTYASYVCNITAGCEYKVRCRAIKNGLYSDWSEYSENVSTIPAAISSGITALKALTETSVKVSWSIFNGSVVNTAENYEIEYTTDKEYFNASSEVQSFTVEATSNEAVITGLETGKEWFFRVRAVNEIGESDWTTIKSIKLGTAPGIPTTWSSTTTVVAGEELTLYWIHNSEDGSSQTYATLELIIDGSKSTHVIQNSTDEDEKDKTSFYVINTSGYREGAQIKWRVKTRGILTTYSDWSIQRTVDIYAPPTLTLTVRDVNGYTFTTLKTLPFRLTADPGPDTQTPVSYHVSIVSNQSYETIDDEGLTRIINRKEEIYSKDFDRSSTLSLELSAGDLTLENNISYTITCTVAMNSGLTANDSFTFKVAWDDDEYWPNAEIGYDPDTYSVIINPYCMDENDNLIEGVLLSIYRREFDGALTELIKDVENTKNLFVTDPHPSLNYARYRIVAKSEATGKVCYYDIPGYPINESAIIIQWDEEWNNFNSVENEILEEPHWSGSLVRLPGNIDISEKNSPDISTIEYIGRKYPVGYYGTHLGSSATWNADIPKSDEDTLYALRRLSAYMGDVYVREPSGHGYWANVSVSLNIKHIDVVIPVSFDITRVAGGV